MTSCIESEDDTIDSDTVYDDETNWLVRKLMVFKLNSFVGKRDAIATIIKRSRRHGKFAIATYTTAEVHLKDYLTTTRVFYWFVDAMKAFAGCETMHVFDLTDIRPSNYGLMLIIIYNPENDGVIIAESCIDVQNRPVISLSKCF
jgi:hypothetical protein